MSAPPGGDLSALLGGDHGDLMTDDLLSALFELALADADESRDAATRRVFTEIVEVENRLRARRYADLTYLEIVCGMLRAVPRDSRPRGAGVWADRRFRAYLRTHHPDYVAWRRAEG